MSNQDDLETDYKNASNELPSGEVDQFILKAAADAIKESPEEKEHTKTNIIQGRFSLRRWQTPLSLAATAVITVSIVTSLKPWQVSTPMSVPVPSQPVEMKSDRIISQDKTSAAKPAAQLSEPENTSLTDSMKRTKARTKTELSDAAEEQLATADSVSDKGKQLRKKQEQMGIETEMTRQKAIIPEPSRSENIPESIVVEQNLQKDNSPSLQAVPVAAKKLMPDIEQWLSLIEQDIKDSQVENARKKRDVFLRQHPVESLSEQERLRFQKIQQALE